MKFLLIITLLIIPPSVCFNLDISHPEVISIFITIIGLWLTEAIPLPVTGLLVPVLSVLYGALSTSSAFSSFGSDILFLFLGCFLIGKSMEKYGFDKRAAYYLLGSCMVGTSFLSINVIIALTSFFLSMWISNTSATAVLAAVTLGIITCLEPRISDEKMKKMASVRLLLTCAFAGSIGGLATPIGSPPNLIALKFLEQNGITISFIEWISIGLPISICMLFVLLFIFEILFPLRSLVFPGIKDHFKKLLKELGPMKTGEIQIAVIFGITITLWIIPGLLENFLPESELVKLINSRFSMSIVGLIGGLSAFFLPVRTEGKLESNISWSDTDKLDWGTLMLFGGGLTLGLLLEKSGAATDLGNFILVNGELSMFMFGVVVVVVSILMSEFASNTAAASILIPIIIASAIAKGSDAEIIKFTVLACAFGASFGFMLPVSTPPNAIVYGTGKVPASEMRKAGIFFDIIGALIIILALLVIR